MWENYSVRVPTLALDPVSLPPGAIDNEVCIRKSEFGMYVDMYICGYVDMYMCGYVYMWMYVYSYMWMCVYIWICM
jgi:hypothetical protein